MIQLLEDKAMRFRKQGYLSAFLEDYLGGPSA